MQELKDFLTEHAFAPPTLELDGNIHRFGRNGGKDNAWYIGWRNTGVRSGQTYEVAMFGDWRTREQHTYKPSGGKLSREDQAAIKLQLEAASKKFAEEKIQRQKDAADKADRQWNSAGDVFESPYYERKLIAAAYGTRTFIAEGGRGVLVPMRDIEGVLWGAQKIFPDGQKRFMTGQRVDGTFHVIGDIAAEKPLLICEGFATGASLHMATGYPVAVAFNAGNLATVALELRKHFSGRSFVICADDDRWNFNPKTGEPDNAGRSKGQKAAMLAQAAIVFPVFGNLDGKPTDFNDLHVREGIEAVRKLFVEPPAPETGFIPLGTDEGTDFYYVVAAKDVVRISAYTDVNMARLAPADYWAGKYPSKTGTDWQGARMELARLCQAVGPFDVGRIRGTGVWLDDGRVVVNTGHSLIVDGKPQPLNGIRSWYVYVQTKKRMPPLRTDPLTADECRPLVDAVAALNWRAGEQSGYFLAGWLAIARIAGALPVRPHVWLTGSAAVGKSTVMDRVVSPCLGGPAGKIFAQGGTTEAGIRQELRSSSVPVIFDEFETTGMQSSDRIASLVELMRQTWSQTQGAILKGSAGGGAVQYQLAFAALVSSIRVSLENDADRSRFAVLDMEPHGSDLDQWNRLAKLLAKLTPEFGERLFARSCALLPTILESQRRISAAFVKVSSTGQRMAQQYGMLMAGYWSLLSDEPPTPEIAESLVKEIELSDQKKDAELTDELECLNHLLTTRVTLRIANGSAIEKTVGQVIAEGNDADHVALKTYGVMVTSRGIMVANGHAELAKIFAGTRWRNKWRASFLRIQGATKDDRAWYGATRSRSVLIPFDAIPSCQADLSKTIP